MPGDLPSGTSRATPTGNPMGDGYSTKITIAADTDIDFWEKTVTPPGLDGGDPVDTTTMYNLRYRTLRARNLQTVTEVSATVAYDAAVYSQIQAVINVETTITITFPAGDTVAFYGYLRSFIPGEIAEGAQPEATITIQPTNWDSAGGTTGEPGTAIVFTSD